ncbi:ribonuclease H-like domain-containing protein [Tanacetum coccineum]
MLGTENYRIRSGAMKLALEAKNKYGFVDGTCLKTAYASGDVLYAQWDRCNVMVLKWILNFVSHDVYIGLVYSDNCASVWNEVQETYDKVDRSVVYNLLQKINTVKQHGSSVADYYHRLNSLWREVDALTKLPKYTCEPVRSALLTRDPLLDAKGAYNIMSREESHRGVPESFGVFETKMNATSFAAKSFNKNRKNFNSNNNTRGSISNGNNGNRGPNTNLNCKNCGKIRHTIERCYELIRFTLGFKKFANNAKQYYNANVDVKCDKQSSVSPSSGFTSTDEEVVTISLGWIIDSGTNQHLTVSIVGMFSVVDISSLNITFGHPNGTLATISHVGNLKLTNNVVLYDVLVVLSYCELTRQKTLRTGSEFGGLYLFDMPPKCSLGESNMVISFNAAKLLWHNRLGHPADQVLSTLHNDLKISTSSSVPICEVERPKAHGKPMKGPMAGQTRRISTLSTHGEGVEFMIIAGADNHPPMLEKSMYDSLKSRMELYMENKENGRMVLDSIQNGPLVWPTIVKENGTTRKKKYEELSVT